MNLQKSALLSTILALLVAVGLMSQRDSQLVQELFFEWSTPDPTLQLVEKVVDGDTIKVRIGGKTETVRLVGINAPESVDPRKTVECFGREAAARLTELVADRQVTLQVDDTQADRDRYGRLLRFVFVEDQDVGLQLLQEGYVLEALYGRPHVYHDAYVAAQQVAETEGRGLWAVGACAQ